MIERARCKYCDQLLLHGETDLPVELTKMENAPDIDEKTFVAELHYLGDDGEYIVPKIWLSFCRSGVDDSNIDMELEVRFCPMCGRDLHDYLDANFDDMKKRGVIA